MLTSLEITLMPPADNKFSFHLGSLLHGFLIENIDSEYAGYLHNNQLKPFSQFLYFDKKNKKYIWKINVLNKEAKEQLLIPLISNINDSIKLKNKSMEISVENKTLSSSISYKKMSEDYYLNLESKKRNRITFLTPVSFKSGGGYTIFFEVHNLYSNLLKKWNSFATGISLEDDEVKDHLIKYTKVIGYNLKSTKFGMEGVRINSFLGEVCLIVNGPDSLVRIANLLFKFGEYSGLGVKTALGMGGMVNE